MPAEQSDKRSAAAVDIAYGLGPIADITAPTVAEIVALQRIECGVVGSNPFTPSRSTVTTSGRSQCDTESYDIPVAITNGNITFNAWRYDDAVDVMWTLFDDQVLPRAKNYLVVCEYGFGGAVGAVTGFPGTAAAPLAGDVVNVYETLLGSRNPMYGQDTLQMFGVELGVIGTAFDITVLA